MVIRSVQPDNECPVNDANNSSVSFQYFGLLGDFLGHVSLSTGLCIYFVNDVHFDVLTARIHDVTSKCA